MNLYKISHSRPLIALAALLLALIGAALWAPRHSLASNAGPVPLRVNTANWSGNPGYGSLSAPAMYMDSTGIVHLMGGVKQVSGSGSDPTLIGELGSFSNFNPPNTVYTIVHTLGGTYADLAIDPQGRMHVIPSQPCGSICSNFGFVSLDGVSFASYNAIARIGPATPLNGLNLTNWASSTSYGSASPGYNVDANGFVYLQGGVTQVSTSGDSTLVMTLPPGLIPCVNIFTIAHTFAGTYTDLAIESNGQVRVIPALAPAHSNFAFLSLDGLSYQPCFSRYSAFQLNTPPWYGNAGYGSASPGYFVDGDGTVHLKGAVKLVCGCGSQSSWTMVGTLPAGARPQHSVYTIVHTFQGTYADLAIDTGGRIWVIAPANPAVPDFDFLSLESITFANFA